MNVANVFRQPKRCTVALRESECCEWRSTGARHCIGANGNAGATARAGAFPIDQVRAAVRIDASTASMRRVTRARIAAFEPTIASDDAMIR